jgi:RNA polymerase sigma-70 factor (ECF subfamily)
LLKVKRPVGNEYADVPAEVVAQSAPPAPSYNDEQALVAQAQAGSAAAFGELYERYVDRVYSYVAFKLGDRTEAEDVTEQVFLKALESIGSFRWQGVPFSAWLFRIAHNQVVDHLRRRTRRPQVPLDVRMRDEAPAGDPEEHVDRLSEREELLAAMGKLTELQRRVIELRFAAELPNAEVARILGRTEGAVKALQHAAIAALQRHLRPKKRQ